MHAYIGLGGNLGEPEKALDEAVNRIASIDGVRLCRVSSLYRTEPVDSSGPDYLNAVAKIETELSAQELLQKLLRIEQDLGRVRPAGIHNAPRTVDLDLLLLGDIVSTDPFVLLPHPRLTQRAFVLVPLIEIEPECKIAQQGAAQDFLPAVADQKIMKYQTPETWVSLYGEVNGREKAKKAR